MAKILGINLDSHDSAACLLVDGKLVASAEQERFSRRKHDYSPPADAVQFCLEAGGLTVNDLDCIAFPWLPSWTWPWQSFGYLNESLARYGTMGGLYAWWTNLPLLFPGAKRSYFRYRVEQCLGTENKSILSKVSFFRHHECHAASTYFSSGFQSAAIVTCDGRGEKESATVYNGEGDELENLLSVSINNSLGNLYDNTSIVLGWDPYEGAGKVMGLAPYGAQKYDPALVYKPHGSLWKLKSEASETPAGAGCIERSFELRRRSSMESPLDPKFASLALMSQQIIEDGMVRLSKLAIERAGVSRLCLSGGVALNCKANMLVRKSLGVQEFYAFGPAGDSGSPIGAAMLAARELGDDVRQRIEHLYWGPGFSNDEIEEQLRMQKVKYDKVGDIEGACAQLVAKGKIVGWFQGRMEIGPRALGNRSILSDPRTVKSRDDINRAKGRETWRPLCPSILDEAKDEYLEDSYDSPFMILSFKVREERRNEVAGVVHVDGTTRPQTVKKTVNPRFYSLIKEFSNITGVPMVTNTSFNAAGKPIVATPRDAVVDFFETGLDYLALGDFLISKD